MKKEYVCLLLCDASPDRVTLPIHFTLTAGSEPNHRPASRLSDLRES